MIVAADLAVHMLVRLPAAPDAICTGWHAGEPNEEMIAELPKSQAPPGLEKGMVVQLTNGMQVGRRAM